MTQEIVKIAQASPELLVFLALAIGYFVGKIKIKGITSFSEWKMFTADLQSPAKISFNISVSSITSPPCGFDVLNLGKDSP